MASHLNALAGSETEGKDGTSPVLNQAPLVNFSGHKDEGYAVDWSPALAGRLLSGIVTSEISIILKSSYLLLRIVNVCLFCSPLVRGLQEYDSSLGASCWFMDC